MIKEIKNQTEWDTLVAEQGGHPLQLWAWGELKRANYCQIHMQLYYTLRYI
ncbi:hypothetical protein FWH58_01000 [Candidatus Saccharibacteria bacterium]|nr:hypothetical protein [Candidatus Saccharibacteria bacterium]